MWALRGVLFFFQAEDGIRDLVRSRGLGDVYKRQGWGPCACRIVRRGHVRSGLWQGIGRTARRGPPIPCLLYTSDAADERSSVDLGGRRIIKQKKRYNPATTVTDQY